jgi:hypothetical protein
MKCLRTTIASLCVLLAVATTACGSPKEPKSTERPLTLDEATVLANAQYDNYQDGGATFRVATAFTTTGDSLNLEGVIDWKHHIGYAVAVAKGAEDGITEVYWTDQMVLERRPAADALLTGMGYSGVKYFVRSPQPDKRLLDRALAIVVGLASTQRENPQLLMQKVGSAYVREDTLRSTAVTVLRFGERNLYWMDAATKKMLRFEGNAQAGSAPTIIDLLSRGTQTIDFPAQDEAIEVSAMQELYDALRAGASPIVSATGP